MYRFERIDKDIIDGPMRVAMTPVQSISAHSVLPIEHPSSLLLGATESVGSWELCTDSFGGHKTSQAVHCQPW